MNNALLATLKKRLAELLAELATIQKGIPTSIQPLVQRKADAVVADMLKRGYKVRVFQGFRSIAEQDALYAQGRTKPGAIVTNAKGGESLHNYGVAVDIVFIDSLGRPSWSHAFPWKTLGQVGKAHGFEWGGDWTGFPDLPHFQLMLGYTLKDFKSNKVDYKRYV
jgi:peptidoglycan L-alanyl-D-glutamate endopeptidase CwlK